jgi:methylmalonyl-CoA mutase C-terminal domain/subunit
MQDRKVRVLVAKPGLDGHDRGIKIVARGLRDAGMEVIYLGLRLTPEQIAEAAVQEDVDVLGIDCLSGAHLTLFPKIVDYTRKKHGSNILIIAGGIIPEKDIPVLKKAGIAEIFGPGTSIDRIISFIRANLVGEIDDKKD